MILKNSKLVRVLQRLLKAHRDPRQYLVNIFCHVLRNQQYQGLREITTFRRHVKIKGIDNIEPVQVYTLHH